MASVISSSCRALGRMALDGHRIDGVVPADENVDALYEYLIGGE